mmetsp:Transcript_63735/g.151933  ORF Transcript_63735/g.151933 Transcript_63735/m.151933 type:complete len:1223 (+) Transcript_63735:69-3737(+)
MAAHADDDVGVSPEDTWEDVPEGIDLGWPQSEDGYAEFAASAVEHIRDKGFCSVHMFMNDYSKMDALKAAKPGKTRRARKGLRYARAKKDIERIYVGRGQESTKVAWMAGLAEEGAAQTVLDECDLMFSGFSKLILPLAEGGLGIAVESRTTSMFRMPLLRDEEGLYEQTDLDEDDVQAGALDEHVEFAKRRTLCMFLVVHGSGSITVQHKDPGSRPQTVALESGQMLVFRHDQMSFEYSAAAGIDNLVMQAWVLKSLPEVPINMLSADLHAADELRGLLVGPRSPAGERVQAHGMSVGLPAGAHTDYTSWWSAVSAGTDGYTKAPLSRYDPDMYFMNHENFTPGLNTYTSHAGFVNEDIYSCDCSFFNWTEDEAKVLSPEIKKCSERGYEACFMAGETRKSLDGRRIGCYTGNSGSDWNCGMLAWITMSHEKGYCARTWSGLVNRMSFEFNLKGPVAHADTACSSSLIAYGMGHTAMRQCEAGQEKACAKPIEEAIVIGVNLIPGPGNFIALSGGQMLSINGRCFTFDNSADGFGRGEGTGALFLRYQAYSEESIAAVIGACMNQDGRSATLTAPNGPSQSACIRGSMQEAGSKASDITVAELHGTGTALGDPIEVGALRAVMQDRGENPILQTSAKTHIGHLEAGAGMAGLQKAMLMCANASGTPNCHLRDLNAHLDVEGYPTVFPDEAVDFLANAGFSGVSSFGFGGANARADVWACALNGPHRVGELDSSKADYIYTSCPFDGGPISAVDGVAVPPLASKNYARGPFHAISLRDEFASYDCSSYVYQGEYLVNPPPNLVADEEHPSAAFPLAVCGSWTAFQELQELHAGVDGTYTFTVELGETRFESFHFVVDMNKDLLVYPALRSGTKSSRAMGPDDGGSGHNWVIDGRDHCIPAGTVYKVSFTWGEPIIVTWDQDDGESDPVAAQPKEAVPQDDGDDEESVLAVAQEALSFQVKDFQHMLYIVGSWNGYSLTELKKVPDERGLWEIQVRLGSNGQERFHFVRDKSEAQCIYPASNLPGDAEVAVCGPDDLGHGKDWLVSGAANDNVTIQLRLVDAHLSLSVASAAGIRRWESRPGLKRHGYSVSGSFNGFRRSPMEVDGRRSVHTLRAKIGETGQETFTVLVDDDPGLCFYPEMAQASPGDSIVLGPDANKEQHVFVVSSLRPGVWFEIILDFNALDRRRVVDIRWLSQPVDHDSLVTAFYDFYYMHPVGGTAIIE